MVPIYLCDDEDNIRTYFCKQIEQYSMIQEYDMGIVCETASPHELLKAIAENPKRGIYFLDVDLKNKDYDGFSLAKQIRKIDEHGFIIFVTTHGELTLETFRHHIEAMDYIIKDESDNILQRIQECLDTVQRKLQLKISPIGVYYSINIFGTIHHLPQKDILYFETSPKKHRLIAHTSNETLEFFGNLSAVEIELSGGFVKVHRSFLVNRDKIKKFYASKNMLQLENDQYCPVSRALKQEIKQQLLDY